MPVQSFHFSRCILGIIYLFSALSLPALQAAAEEAATAAASARRVETNCREIVKNQMYLKLFMLFSPAVASSCAILHAGEGVVSGS